MNALQKAQARLKELVAELDELQKKEQLSADDLKAINEKIAEIEAKEAEITTLKAAEAIRARQTVPADTEVPASDRVVDRGHNRPPAAPQKKMEPDQKISLIAAASLKSMHLHQPYMKVLDDNGYGQFVQELQRSMSLERAVDTTVASVLIPQPLSAEIIELLRPETTFFQGNPKRVQFTNGKFKSPRGASGATASYVGEGAKKPVTGPTFDSIDMAPKKLAGIVLITKEAREWTLPNIEAYIRDDLRAAMAQATDLNAYFGTGVGDSPTGVLNITGVPSVDAQSYAPGTAPSITQIDAFASKMILSITQANIGQAQTWKWLMSYRTLEFLKNLRVGDDTGVYAYPTLQLERPTWKGFGVLVTNQVAENLGATTDETTLSLLDFRHVLYGEEEGVVVKTSDQATIDVSGTLVHLFQQNMDAILTETQHDFGLRHLHAVVKGRAVRWGSTGAMSPN